MFENYENNHDKTLKHYHLSRAVKYNKVSVANEKFIISQTHVLEQKRRKLLKVLSTGEITFIP